MNPNWSDAQNWLDIVDHIWIGFVLLAVAAVPSWFAARNHKSIQDVKNQVVNGHTTPLRADLDAMRNEVVGIRDEMRGGFTALRGDLSEERLARRAGDAAIRDEMSRHHPPT